MQKKLLHLPEPFVTESGVALKRPQIVYDDGGNPDGPVILITHGGFADQHVAGRYCAEDPTPGWWDGLIGPGKAIDTDTFRVLCMNALGSMYGSTSPLTMNPDTGCRYGPHFPPITLIDMARYQKAFLDAIGVEELHLVAGPAMGAMTALQLAALYPELIGAAVAVAGCGRTPPAALAANQFIINVLTMDPAFQGGWYDLVRPLAAMKTVHQFLRIMSVHEDLLKTAVWDAVHEGVQAQAERGRAISRYLTATLDIDVRDRDPNCYITLLGAINSYDLGRDVGDYEAGVLRIQCPVLLLSVDTDTVYRLEWAEEVADILNTRMAGQARIGLIDSPWGHLGSIKETEQLCDFIASFVAAL
ncbi:MAG: alpha/beta fold hydrolase [Xanthomonadaceae bacterium]|nr:alpha/beta fold hydrolase [Xanthomonadaceae bacterium]